MPVIQQLAGSTNMIAQVFAQVLASAVWAVNVVASLQAIEPATDTWQVNRVFEVIRKQGKGDVQLPDGSLALASSADYSSLFMPDTCVIDHRRR